MRIGIGVIVILLFFTVSCNKFERLLKSTNYELKYEKALQYYDKENYTRAFQLLEELIPVFKGTDRAEEVYYRYAWCNYHLGDVLLAQYHFKNFARQFPNSPRAEECYFMNAYCYYISGPKYDLDQTNTKNAIKEIQSFVDNFPDSRRIDTCNLLIDEMRAKIEKKDFEILKLWYKIEDYKAAIVQAQNFIDDYPSGIYTEKAYDILIRSYFLLAEKSIPEKKAERYSGVVDNYLNFINLFPNSSYISGLENLYLKAKKELNI
jgi:outer membrane protein assembly factor BamD